MLATPGGSWKGQHRTDHGGEQLFPRTYAPPGAKGYKHVLFRLKFIFG